MSDLTEFLLARIAEDYADAMSGWRWKGLPAGEYERLQARVLADCEAKRRIVEDRIHLDTLRPGAIRAHSEWACRVLATIYADHPDCREEWRP